jgi:hypothetical protein
LGWGEREGVEWVVREWVGAGGEMIQALYAHMNNKRKRKKKVQFWVPVAHTYNPSYLGDRVQKDHSLKPVQANSSRYTISKIPNTNVA